MKEYFVRFVRLGDEESSLIVLPSFRKLLLWFLRTAWRCDRIVIFTRWN